MINPLPISNPRHSSVVAAVASFFIWGFLPLYYKTIDVVAVSEILAHRVIWSLLFALVLILVSRQIKNWLGCADQWQDARW